MLSQQTIRLMGDEATLYAPAGDDTSITAASQSLRMFAGRFYPLIDVYSPDSEISRANQIATRSRFPISRDTQRIVEHAQQLSVDLSGYFDITDATLRHLWQRHFSTEPGELLPAPLIQASRRGVGPHMIDVGDHSLLYLSPDTQLDLNEFVKPYVIDLAISQIRRQGASDVLIAMGNMGRALGHISHDKSWTRDVPHPRDANRSIGHILLPDGTAFAMFGLQDHFISVGGEEVARIIDPTSGWPAKGAASVVVIGPAAAESYALAQALFIAGRERGTEMIRHMGRYQALFVHPVEPLEIWITPGFASLFIPADEYRDTVRLIETPKAATQSEPPPEDE